MTAVADTRPLRHWLHAANHPQLVLCCVEHSDVSSWASASGGAAVAGVGGSKGAVVQLDGCIADLSPAVLLELVAGGASGITVALDGCADAGVAEAVAARAASFLSALDRSEGIASATASPAHRKHEDGTHTDAKNTVRKPPASWPILGESAVPVSRRALFGRADRLVLAEPSEHPTQRLVEVLRELAGPKAPGPKAPGPEAPGPEAPADRWTELDAIPTGVPTLTASRCAGTGVCARTCPVDALTLTRTVLAQAKHEQAAIAQFRLTFDPASCTDCGKCLEVCPENAIERSGDYLWSSLLAGERVDLRAGLIRPCARCGGGYGGSGELCAVCAYRAVNPFGSTMPPGHPDQADPLSCGQPPRR